MSRIAKFIVLAVFVPACSFMPPRSDHVRAQQMEEAVLPMAATALEVGQLETARRLYRRLLVIDPESVEARMGMGDVAMREQESEAAARWYLSALTRAERPGQRHAALLAHGRGALAAGQLDAAQRSFKQLSEPSENAPRPSVAWGHNGTGLTLLLLGDLQGGVAAMEQAVLLAPEEDRFRGNLDRALAMLRDFPISNSPDGHSIGATGAAPADPENVQPSSFAEDPASATRPKSNAQFARDEAMRHPPEKDAVLVETDSIAAAAEQPMVTTSRPSTETAQAAAEPMAQKTEERASLEDVSVGREAEASGAARPPQAKESSQSESAATEIPQTRSRVYVVDEKEAYFLQFGAFAELANAETVVAELRHVIERPAQITAPEVGAGVRLHRVRIGPLFSDNEMLDLVAAFEAAGYVVVNRPRSGLRSAVESGVEPEAMTTILVREDGERFLQAGAFAERKAAEDLADELRELTHHLVEISVFARSDGPPLHRVRVGPLVPDDPLLEMLARQE